MDIMQGKKKMPTGVRVTWKDKRILTTINEIVFKFGKIVLN